MRIRLPEPPSINHYWRVSRGITHLDVAGAGGCLVFNDATAKCWGGMARGAGPGDPSTAYPTSVQSSPGAPLTGAVSTATGTAHAAKFVVREAQ